MKGIKTNHDDPYNMGNRRAIITVSYTHLTLPTN